MHRPIDQIVCLMPDVQYGKVTWWTKGFTLTPPNFLINDANDCDDFYNFDPVYDDWSDWDYLIDNFEFAQTDIKD